MGVTKDMCVRVCLYMDRSGGHTFCDYRQCVRFI